jgi:hypothetical protein
LAVSARAFYNLAINITIIKKKMAVFERKREKRQQTVIEKV